MSTSEPYPLYNALRGTLGFEVNFTSCGNPRQKCLRGRLGDLVKFTFWAHPHYRHLWGTLLFEVNFTGPIPRIKLMIQPLQAVISRLFCGEQRERALLEQPRITADYFNTSQIMAKYLRFAGSRALAASVERGVSSRPHIVLANLISTL